MKVISILGRVAEASSGENNFVVSVGHGDDFFHFFLIRGIVQHDSTTEKIYPAYANFRGSLH